VPFACSICEQESTRICAYCTKDACDNHICEHCGCCSDCCDCEVPLDEATAHPHAVPAPESIPALAPEPVPEAPVTPVDQPAVSEEPCAEPSQTPEV